MIPNGLTLVDGSWNDSKWNRSTNVWTYIGSKIVANGSSVILKLSFIVNGNTTGTVTNKVIVKSNETGNNSTNANNNISLNNVSLGVIKVSDKVVANVGDNVTYTITVVNTGSTGASNVTVTELVPNGLTYVGYSNTTSLWIKIGGAWKLVGTLNGNSNAVLKLKFRVNGNATGPVNNKVIVKSSETSNITSTSNNTTLTYICISKVVDNPTPNVGGIVSWTITATNKGTTMVNTTIVDYVPIGLVFYNATGKYKINNLNSTHYKITWNIQIQPNKIITIKLRTIVNSTLNMTNVVLIGENNSANASVVNITNVSVEKTVNNIKPKFGDIIVYDIIVHNNGPNHAFNVITKDTLPRGLIYLGYNTPTMGTVTYDPVSRKITWTIADMPVIRNMVLHIRAQVNLSGVNLTNNIFTTTGWSDPEVGNPTASVTTYIQANNTPKDNKTNNTTNIHKGTIDMEPTGNPLVIAIITIVIFFVPFKRFKK